MRQETYGDYRVDKMGYDAAQVQDEDAIREDKFMKKMARDIRKSAVKYFDALRPNYSKATRAAIDAVNKHRSGLRL